MDAGEISYIFPDGFKTDEYILPETANENNITFANRDYIIDSIIPDENKILKDLLRSEPYTVFGYLHKGENTTKTISAASEFLRFNARHIIKTKFIRLLLTHWMCLFAAVFIVPGDVLNCI